MVDMTKCANCTTTGLPIFFTRYAVVPANLKPVIPDAITGKRVKDVKLDEAQYQYALRTLREGFVYLFYEKGPRGAKYWETYSVAESGRLFKQPGDPLLAAPRKDDSCNSSAHILARTNYICIEHPEKCGDVLIAFSEHKWSKEAINEYTKNSALRNKRMQTIKPAVWIHSPEHPHAIEATPPNLSKIIEFRSDLTINDLAPTHVGEISKVSGEYKGDDLKKQTSLYPVYMRNLGPDKTAEGVNTVKLMHKSGQRPDGKSHPPMMMALWDAVGITHELNGYRNEPAGRIQQYSDERSMEITAMNAIEGIKEALKHRASEQEAREYESMQERAKMAPDNTIQNIRYGAASRYSNNPADLNAKLANLDDQYENEGLSYDQYQAQRTALIQQGSTNPAAMQSAYQQIDHYRNARAQGASNLKKHYEQNAADDAEADWGRYQKKLDAGQPDIFKGKYQVFLTEADKIISARTIELIKWLEAPLLHDTLEDCHGDSMQDGLEFEDKIGSAIFGMNSSQKGVEKIEAWVKEAKASVKSNLLWRAVALNQNTAIPTIDEMLAAAHDSTPLTEATLQKVSSQKWNKIVDLLKKAQSLSNANASAIKKGMTRKETLHGLDRILLTMGTSIFKVTGAGWAIDTVGHKIVQTFLFVRADINLNKALDLVAAEAQYERVAEQAMRRRLRATIALGGTIFDEKTNTLTKEEKILADKWSGLRKTANDVNAEGSRNAAMDARLALVVAVLEAANFRNLWNKSDKDAKVKAQLIAAAMSTTSATMDVAANVVKGLWSDSEMSFQKLKLGGACLSGVASTIGAVLDFVDAWNETFDKRHYCIGALYAMKGGIGIFSALGTLRTGVTYSVPLIRSIAGRTLAAETAVVVGEEAAAMVVGRVILMAAGWEFTAVSLIITGLIYLIKDDDLQKWCLHCAFGKERNTEHFKDANEQYEACVKALRAVL